MESSLRDRLYAHIKKTYGLLPEHPYAKRPNDAVFLHTDNMHAFAVVREKGDILEVKMPDIMLVDMFVKQPGFFRGQRGARGNWLGVTLDGTVSFAEITRLLSDSFLATASAKTRQQMRPPREWVIPSNPKYYDIIGAFEKNTEIQWKQAKGIKVNDTVFMYVGIPYSAILFKCLVTETNIPYRYQDKDLTISELMTIKLMRRYPADRFRLNVLSSQYGIVTIRGPRGIPKNLSDALNA